MSGESTRKAKPLLDRDPGLVIVAPIDTGKGGPNSLCWICYETGKTVPSCDLPYCPQVETVDKPCTIYPPCTIA